MIKKQRKVNETITHYKSNILAPLKVERAEMMPLTNKKKEVKRSQRT